MNRSILFYLPIFLLLSCEKEAFHIQPEPEPEPEQASDIDHIPTALVPHFHAFAQAAEERGYVVNFARAGITAEMRTLNQGSVAGVCSTNNRGLRHITIDTKFWQRAGHFSREMIVFHELGHCLLGRGHTEDKFDNGVCRSIMRSGTGNCFDAYRASTRSYYLDELFDKLVL